MLFLRLAAIAETMLVDITQTIGELFEQKQVKSCQVYYNLVLERPINSNQQNRHTKHIGVCEKIM